MPLTIKEVDMNASQQRVSTARRALEIEAESVLSLSERLGDAFVSAIDILLEAERVFVLGVGKSALVGAKMSATFSSIGKPAHFLHPVDALHGDLGGVTPGSCAIVISKSGTTSELLEVLPYLRQRRIPVIGVLGSVTSLLADRVDIVLDCTVRQEACTMNMVPTASTTAALAMGDALAVVLMSETGHTSDDFLTHHPSGQLGRNLAVRVSEVMHGGEDVPRVHPDAGMRQALIVNSTHGMGCVCVVDAGDRLLGIITDGDIRRLLQHHDDILALKIGDVMTTGPVCASAEMTLHAALQLMEDRSSQISVLPVVDADHVCVGVIRIHDILRS
ncbi:MAG: SIS domain-containing protein [Candidatus Kapaibacterium sp.]